MNIFIPSKSIPISEESVWKWYLNIQRELENDFLTQKEKAAFFEYYREAGLLRAWRKPHFRHHFCQTFTEAANHLFSEKSNPMILDLGCGMGTQTLFLSLLGADVIGIDMDGTALEVLGKRKSFYEEVSGRFLSIQMYNTNVFEFDFEAIPPIDGLYSMFAFNMIQPSRRLLDLICSRVSGSCCFVVLDGNTTSWKPKLIPSFRRKGRLSPQQFRKELESRYFTIISHKAGNTMPPIVSRLLPASIVKSIHNFLGKYWLMTLSHQIMAKR